MEADAARLEKEVAEIRKKVESVSSEGEEKRIAAVKAEYEGEVSSLNEQISLMEEALKEEEAKTQALKEQQEKEVASFRATEDALTKQVEAMSHDLNDENEETRAIQKETQEKQEEQERLNQRMATVEETSRVLREKEVEQERVRVARRNKS